MTAHLRALSAAACLALVTVACGGGKGAESKVSGDLTRLVFEVKAAGSEW